MLGSVAGLQPQQQQSQQQQQQQQQQQLQQQNSQNNIPPPPPPPSSGQDINLSNILHFLQSEWRRYERDRNEWEIERAEMRARIALLEGERRSFENTKIDLLRRIKMLEYALRMERSKQLTQVSNQSIPPSKLASLQFQTNAAPNKDDSSNKAGSSGSSPRSEDAPLPSDNRMSISSLPVLPNGAANAGNPNKAQTWGGSNWQSGLNGTAPSAIPLGKPPLGRDPKSRARSREYLKQCLQEISYLTSPQAMNPLPNRPLLNNPTVSLAIPNVPSFDMAYNGRPRKMVPEVGKDFPVLNGMNMTAGTSNTMIPASQMPMLERDTRLNMAPSVPLQHPNSSQQPLQGQPPGFQQQSLTQSSESQFQQFDGQRDTEETQEPQIPTAFFRPDEGWRDQLRLAHEAQERVRMNRFGTGLAPSSTSSWDGQSRDDEEETKEEDSEVEEEESTSVGENGGKVWKPRKTLRNHLDAVRALSFHPSELCLATGGDDCTIKIWRTDATSLAANVNRTTDEIEPQLTLRGHTGPITRLIQSPSKGVIYSASLDSSIRVWTIPPASHTTYAPYDHSHGTVELVGHTDAVWDLALIRDENLLISCGAEGAVKVWQVGGSLGSSCLKLSWGYNGLDSDQNSDNSELPEDCGATTLEAIKSDLKQVAVAYQTGIIKLFDIDSGKFLMKLQSDSDSAQDASISQINAMISHPTMSLLVTAEEDKHIRIFDLITGQCTHSMVAHLDAVTSLSIDAAGFSLVSGSHDCSLRFWDLLGTRTCIQELTSHREKASEGVLAVEFHPSLPVMASAGADGVVKLYASS